MKLEQIRDNPTLNRYFFEKLRPEDFNKPSKYNLSKLDNAGFFTTSWGKRIYKDGSYNYHGWPAGDYLSRVVKLPLTKNDRRQLIKIATKVNPNGNPWVVKPLLDIACTLNAEESRQLIPCITDWLQALNNFRMTFLVQDWILHLIKMQAPDQAFIIFKSMIDEGFLADYKINEIDYRGSVWEVNHAIEKTLPELAKILPVETYKYIYSTLDNLIQRWVVINKSENLSEEWYSYIWKQEGSLLTEHSENNIIAVFIDALTIVIQVMGEITPQAYEEVIKALAESQWETFRRVSWAFIKRSPSSSYSELRKLLKKTSHRDVEERAPKVRRVSHNSPLSDSELDKLSWTQIVDYILNDSINYPENSWDNEKPDRQGLRNAIESKINKNPQSFLANWEVVKSLPPEEIEPIICGLRGEHGQEPIPVEKDKLHKFLEWCMQDLYPPLDPPLKDRLSRDIILLIRRRFIKDLPPLQIFSPIAKILQIFVNNPTSSLKEEYEKLKNDISHVVDLSINVNHAEALETLFDGIFKAGQKWVDFRKRDDYEDIKSYVLNLTKSVWPTQIHILSQQLNNFLSLDKKWTLDYLVPRLFDKEDLIKYEAAKLGFLRCLQVSTELLPYYKQWVEELKTLPESFQTKNWEPERFLVGHIIFYHITNSDPLETGYVGHDLFINAPIVLRRKAIARLSQFMSAKHGLDLKAQQRAKILFEWRKDKGAIYEELVGMLEWLGPILNSDTVWANKQLVYLLTLAKGKDDDATNHTRERVLHLLDQGNKGDLDGLMKVLKAWINIGPPRWFSEDTVENLLTLFNKDPKYENDLRKLINIFSSYGYLKFRRLLEKK